MRTAAEIEGGEAVAHAPAGADLEDVEEEKLQEIDFDDGEYRLRQDRSSF